LNHVEIGLEILPLGYIHFLINKPSFFMAAQKNDLLKIINRLVVIKSLISLEEEDV
jgi:hypothetical protein